MANDQSYMIGHVSRICGISIQTLRYYDKLGLVCPSKKDPWTNYRYYSNMDILLVKIVQDLKGLRFSLEEISRILKHSGLDGLTTALQEKKRDTKEEIQRLQRTAASIESRIEQLDRLKDLNKQLHYEDAVLIELRWLDERLFAYDRKKTVWRIENYTERFTQLFERVERHGLTAIGQIMSIYHDNLMALDQMDADIEAAVLLSSDTRTAPFVRTLPASDYIVATYNGPPNDKSCKKVYRQLLEWIEQHGYVEHGPAVEQYMVDWSQMRDPNEFIVELQIPVEKILTL